MLFAFIRVRSTFVHRMRHERSPYGARMCVSRLFAAVIAIPRFNGMVLRLFL